MLIEQPVQEVLDVDLEERRVFAPACAGGPLTPGSGLS